MLLNMLAKERRYARALDIWSNAWTWIQEYVPEPGSLVGPLAEQALKDKRLKLFARLDNAVRARKPQGDEVVCMQFLKAQALVGQKQDEAALALLTPLVGRHSHPG